MLLKIKYFQADFEFWFHEKLTRNAFGVLKLDVILLVKIRVNECAM